MKRYLAVKSLFHGNTVQFISRGKLYRESDYLFAKSAASLELQFKDEEGNIITISDNPDDDYHYDKLLIDYEQYKLEKSESND